MTDLSYSLSYFRSFSKADGVHVKRSVFSASKAETPNLNKESRFLYQKLF